MEEGASETHIWNPNNPIRHKNTTGCTKNKDKDTKHIGKGGGGWGGHIAEEREKRQWVNHERGSAMADTDILTWKMAPFVSV